MINSTGSPSLGVSSATFALGVSSINWSWSISAGAVAYQLFNAAGGALSPILPPSTLSFVQTGLSTNTAYTNYVEAFSGTSSTNSAALTCYTLAVPTTGLTLLALDSAAETEAVSWGAGTNPPGTTYEVEWWSNVTSTVSVSTQSTTALIPSLLGGGTIYFTVQASNGDGLLSAFDSTFFTVVPSTFFTTSAQSLPANFSGTVNFLIPTGVVSLQVSSNTFASAVTISIQVPPQASVPGVGGSLSPLPSPINLQIQARDASGNPQEPRLPVAITVIYGNAGLGALSPESLVLAFFDATHQAWVPLVTARAPSRNSLTGISSDLSLFSVLGVSAPKDLSAITVGPNPLRSMVNPGQVMAFRNLPAGARVRIFTYVGEKLADLTADGSGLASWDGKNGAGSGEPSAGVVTL